jgi:predicted metal-dependent phosphoesterase TrpH
MTMDFHMHSSCSDGALAPSDVMARAAYHGATVVALTDHDQLAGLDEARAAAQALGMRFVNGVEISVTWRAITLHIVGLNFDAQSPELVNGLQVMAQGRAQRAQKIADQLAQAGVEDMFEAALVHAGGRVDLLSRTHFARELVARKKATSVRTVFQDYLVAGKPGYVSHEWCSLAQAVGWITGAGGVAVFAHPGRCIHAHEGDELELLHEFVALGGRAIEVVTGSHSKNQYKKYTQIAQDFGLFASRGSDFHSSNESKMEAGKVPELPHGLIGVESLFD